MKLTYSIFVLTGAFLLLSNSSGCDSIEPIEESDEDISANTVVKADTAESSVTMVHEIKDSISSLNNTPVEAATNEVSGKKADIVNQAEPDVPINTDLVPEQTEIIPAANAWVAPISANDLINPFKGNLEATKAGKKFYITYCSTCHGETGMGDGAAALALTPKPAKFTDKAVQAQSDGALYWKMTEGKAPMASYKAILKEDQRWQLVNYIRELGKTR